MPSRRRACCAHLAEDERADGRPASKLQNSRKMPSTKPKSPMRLTMKALLPAVAFAELLVPEADQRPRAEADALPADEHEQQVVAQHQRQHREGEEVQVGEEPPVGVVVVHVAGGVEVDQPADAGDDEDHHGGERIGREGEVDVQRADVDPGEQIGNQVPLLRWQPGELEQHAERQDERCRHRARTRSSRPRACRTGAGATPRRVRSTSAPARGHSGIAARLMAVIRAADRSRRRRWSRTSGRCRARSRARWRPRRRRA